MKIVAIITIYSSLLLAGCVGNEAKEASHDDHHHHHAQGDARITEVMAIHDSIMLKMGELMELSEAIKAAGKDSHENSVLAESANQMLIELDQAGEAMMSWMHNFKSDTLDKLNDEEARHYLALQKDGILKVKAKMEKSITNAQKYLNK